MFWWFAIPFLGFITYGTYKYVLDKRYRLPPGTMPLPFIGSIRPAKKAFADDLIERSKAYGPVMTFYMGQVRVVVLQDAKIIHDVLVKQSDIFSDRMYNTLPGFDQIPGGILMVNGELWKQRRRFGMRAMRDFGMGREAMVLKIHDEIDQLLPEITKQVDKPFNPKRTINIAVSNIICNLVFGKRYDYNDPEFHKILKFIHEAITESFTTMITFLCPCLIHLFDPPMIRKYKQLVELVKQMSKKAIEEHRADFNPEIIRDFPDLFLKTEFKDDGIDFESFYAVMVDLFLAGMDTTSTALGWTMLYLASYPEIQKKCQEEIDRVIDTDRLPELKDRPKLVYLDAVMCEILRHTSFTPIGEFHSNCETPAEIEGFEIPPFTMVMYNLKAVHYDKKYWRNPEEFNPDRWISPEGQLLQHSSHFMPFGLGPRVCLGESMARVEYFLFLVAILHRFSFALKTRVDLESPADGFIRHAPDYEVITSAR